MQFYSAKGRGCIDSSSYHLQLCGGGGGRRRCLDSGAPSFFLKLLDFRVALTPKLTRFSPVKGCGGMPWLGKMLLINSTSFLSNTHLFLSPSEERLLLPGGLLKRGIFFWIFSFFLYDIQHCFVCRPLRFHCVGGCWARTVATTAWLTLYPLGYISSTLG